MRRKLVGRISLLAFSLLTPPPAISGPPSWRLEQTTNGITYIEGGIGTEERRAFAAAAKDYPLVLEFAVKHRPREAFTNDVHVILMDANGQVLLATLSRGPFLLADVPAGHYTIQAALDGQALTQIVRVTRHQSTHVLFLWAD